jgi:hypothetical protein
MDGRSSGNLAMASSRSRSSREHQTSYISAFDAVELLGAGRRSGSVQEHDNPSVRLSPRMRTTTLRTASLTTNCVTSGLGCSGRRPTPARKRYRPDGYLRCDAGIRLAVAATEFFNSIQEFAQNWRGPIMVPVGLQQVLELGAVSSAVVMKVARIECAEEPRSNQSSPAYLRTTRSIASGSRYRRSSF